MIYKISNSTLKTTILSILLMSFSCSSHKKNWFKVKNFGSVNIILLEENTDFVSEDIYDFYKEVRKYPEESKIAMIRELLSFKEDKRNATNFVVNYNKNLSQFYKGDVKNVSIKTEALFLINQIYFDNPFYYSPIPVLINKQSKKEIVNDTEIMNNIYQSYLDWFNKIEKLGFEEAKEKDLKPLDDSSYMWIYGIDIKSNSPLMFEI